MNIKISALVLFVFLFFNCKKTIFIEGFDNKKWEQDKGGCEGIRKVLALDLIKVKNQMKGFTSQEIISFIGRPDKEDLYSRNQKFFYYFIEQGEHCLNNKEDSDTNFLSIRFSALNKATEISFKKNPR